MAALTVLAVALLGHGLVSGRLRGLAITGPMVFVAVGFLTGSEVFDVASFDLKSETVIVLAEATLAVVLFSDAVRVDLRQLRGFIGLPTRMLGLGLPLVIGAGTLTMRYVVDLSWARAALIASILAATDAALSQAVLTDEEVPRCIRGSLNVESGLNDGLVLPAVTLFSALTVADSEGEAASFWIQFLAEQIGFGVLAGIVVGSTGGRLLVQASRKGWVEGISGQLAALSLVGLAFLSAHALGGNSFIAAFVAGVSFRAVGAEDAEHLSEFTEDSGQLLATLTFVVFGNALFGPAVDQLTVPIAISVVLSLTVVRMAPIALSLLGTGLRPPTLAFLGWFGPRGLASALFALTVLEETGAPATDPVFVVVAWTVVVSVIVHGASASWGAGRYARWYERHRAGHPSTPSEGTEPMSMPRVRGAAMPRDVEASEPSPDDGS